MTTPEPFPPGPPHWHCAACGTWRPGAELTLAVHGERVRWTCGGCRDAPSPEHGTDAAWAARFDGDFHHRAMPSPRWPCGACGALHTEQELWAQGERYVCEECRTDGAGTSWAKNRAREWKAGAEPLEVRPSRNDGTFTWPSPVHGARPADALDAAAHRLACRREAERDTLADTDRWRVWVRREGRRAEREVDTAKRYSVEPQGAQDARDPGGVPQGLADPAKT